MSVNASREIERLRAMAWGELAVGRIEFQGEALTIESVLRHLPGRRLAVKALWQGRVVFAKIFLTADTGVVEKEIACIQSLMAAQIATPSLLAHELFSQGGVILCEWCEGLSGEDALRENAEEALPELMASVFSLYDAGLYQRDLHLNNFILFENRFLIIDAGDIQSLAVAPSGRDHQIVENLALFCAQGSLDTVALLQQHVCRGMSERHLPSINFARRVRHKRNVRIRSAMKKWRRESSAIGKRVEASEQWLWQRQLCADDIVSLTALLREPTGAPLIKRGSRISVYGTDRWIIKHYREAGFLAKLKRLFFRGRADISWVIGWTWRLLNVPTPQPLMLRRCANGEAVIACQRIAAQPLSHLMEQGSNRAGSARIEVVDWLARLHGVGFWHGDTKAQNILCDARSSWFIDLDAAGWSALRGRVKRRGERDIARFKRNEQQFLTR